MRVNTGEIIVSMRLFIFSALLFCPLTRAVTRIEQLFLDVPAPESARESLQFITSKPHVAGTPGDYEMAQYVHGRFAAEGIPNVEIQAVDVLLSNPVDNALELIDVASGSVSFSAALAEDVLDEDPTSDTWYRNHTYNAYSPSGDVIAQMVYTNYGRPEDLDTLESMGVSLEGKIAIARYGKCFRGLKAMNVQERGSIGLIIYSDPSLDGFNRGTTYPDGRWRPASGVQRGSVQFNSLCAGDPSRVASEDRVEDICGYSKEELVPSIPVIPISYGDAEPLLRALGGAAAPESFQGGLAFNYTVGPSGPNTVVRLMVENEEHVGKVWNVIATIPGSLPAEQDRPVILGNHRDAWIFGAVDPNSGTSALIEVARGLGKLLEEGWRPLRTIVLCSWSGEELGIVGSTAWGEANAQGILTKAAAYLNVDSAVSGSRLHLAVSPSLVGLVRGVLEDIQDPDSGRSLLEAWSGHLSVLGSGSDYAVFLHHLGIASVHFEFQQDVAAEYAVYHSVYDSFAWMTKYGDPSFQYFRTCAQMWGLMALRLVDAEVMPFDPTCLATALETYLSDLFLYHSSLRPSTNVLEKTNFNGQRLIFEATFAPLAQAVRTFRHVADSIDLPPAHKHGCGISNVSGNSGEKGGYLPEATLRSARAASLRGSSLHVVGDEALLATDDGDEAGDIGMEGERDIEYLNERLAMTERHFLTQDGLPNRRWFRHVVQAPGLYLGYGAETFPGITQALDDGDEELVTQQVAVAAACVNDAADFLSGEGR